MVESKKVYSQSFEEYRLDETQLKKLQDSLLSMFLDIKKVCDENNIDYMLSGGTLLGAIRHEGFIPWDDDIDIMMLRSEYEKFREIFSQKCSDQYILAEPLGDENYFFKMPKIYKKNTTYIEISNAGTKKYHMLFVDVFIIENMPNQAWKRTVKGAVYDFAYKGSSVCIDYLFPSPVIETKAETDREVKKYYRFRKKMGCIFSHMGGIHFYLKLCDTLAQHSGETKYLGIPSGISYGREIFERKVLTELGTAMFCGYEVKIPADYDTYLKNLYGDYGKIPPKEKREVHAAYKVEL